MGIPESAILAASLCADCFAVSLCSSVTMREVSRKTFAVIALTFAVIQSILLAAGWIFGNLFVALVWKVAHVIGFLLLLHVGGSMLVGGFKGKQQKRDLNSPSNVILAGIATSIDALSVGVSQSMTGESMEEFLPLLISVFILTALSVTGGLFGGGTIGERFGHRAEIVGGIILIGIGLNILLMHY